MTNGRGYRCGYVAMFGRPNVGKSTLLNRLMGAKLSITSSKPQTTRHKILGIKSTGNCQILYVDTPGLHRNGRYGINRYMNRTVSNVIVEVDVVVFVVEAMSWTDDDQYAYNRLTEYSAPVILAVNKVDRVREKSNLFPYLDQIANGCDFEHVIPLSARRGDNLRALERRLTQMLPLAGPAFPAEQITDQSEGFRAAELIREKLTRCLGNELPYQLSVEVERFSHNETLLEIDALIWVERSSQKVIVIGKHGQQLKRVGSQARADMERIFDKKVLLHLWVKVKEGWRDDERALSAMGYCD